jgi:hypothetical protein
MKTTNTETNHSRQEQLKAVVTNYILAKKNQELTNWQVKKRSKQLQVLKIFPFMWDQSYAFEVWEMFKNCQNDRIRKIEITRNLEECHLFLCQVPSTPQEQFALDKIFAGKQFHGYFVELRLKNSKPEMEESLLSDYKVDFIISGSPFEKNHFSLMMEMVINLHSHNLHYSKSINFGKLQ